MILGHIATTITKKTKKLKVGVIKCTKEIDLEDHNVNQGTLSAI